MSQPQNDRLIFYSNMRFFTALSTACVLIWPTGLCLAEQLAMYNIGNSLTWDSQPLGVAAMAAEAGHTVDVGHHIKCGSPLNNIWEKPDSVCVGSTSFWTFATALPDNIWDAVTFQIYPGQDSLGNPSTLATDQQVIDDMISLAMQEPMNADAKYYIYTGWPGGTAGYQAKWE